jgi:hypothetical protein
MDVLEKRKMFSLAVDRTLIPQSHGRFFMSKYYACVKVPIAVVLWKELPYYLKVS